MEGGGGTSSATTFATGPWDEGVSWMERRIGGLVRIRQILYTCLGKLRRATWRFQAAVKQVVLIEGS